MQADCLTEDDSSNNLRYDEKFEYIRRLSAIITARDKLSKLGDTSASAFLYMADASTISTKVDFTERSVVLSFTAGIAD